MKVCCVSDLHGHLPDIPECELLLIGGDIVPYKLSIYDQYFWYKDVFSAWLDKLPMRVIGCAGNHDQFFEKYTELPKINWTYLQDSGTEFQGLKVWGSPWQPRIWGAFGESEFELHRIWMQIPDDTDILVLHSSPKYFGDCIKQVRGNTQIVENLGSPSITERLMYIQPKLVVSGHIHDGYGIRSLGEKTICVNASHMDDYGNPVHPPLVVEI